MSTNPELSIIIVNWNGFEFLPDCLASIAANPPSSEFEVVIVDNLSTDGSLDWLKSNAATDLLGSIRLRVLEPGKNLGFGAGNNFAFERTQAKYLFLLNPDTLVHPGSIEQLLATLRENPTAGGAAPKILNEDGSIQTSVWGDVPSPLQIVFEGLKLYLLLPKSVRSKWLLGRHWTYDKRQFVPVVSGAAVMIRKQVVDTVGGFDEDFHMYGEDLEWCIRIWRSPNKILFEPGATIVHLGGQSSDQRWDNSEKALVQEKSFLLFQAKTLTKSQRLGNAIAKAIVAGVFLGRGVLLRRNYAHFKEILVIELKTISSICKFR